MINKINRSISYILIAVLGSVARVHTGYASFSSDTYNSLSQEQQDECIDRVLGLLKQCPTDLKSTIVNQLYNTFEQRLSSVMTRTEQIRLDCILSGPAQLPILHPNGFDREIRQFLVELVNGRPCASHMLYRDRALGYTTVVPFLDDYLYTVQSNTRFSINSMLALLRLIKSPFRMSKGENGPVFIPAHYPIRLYFITLIVKDFGNITQIKPLQEIKALLMPFISNSLLPNTEYPEEIRQDIQLLEGLSFLRDEIIPGMGGYYTMEFGERLQRIKDFIEQPQITDHLDTLHVLIKEIEITRPLAPVSDTNTLHGLINEIEITRPLAPVSHAIRACLPLYQTNPASEAASSGYTNDQASEAASSRYTDGQPEEATGSTTGPSASPLPQVHQHPHLTFADLPPQVLQQILSNLISGQNVQ